MSVGVGEDVGVGVGEGVGVGVCCVVRYNAQFWDATPHLTCIQ